MHHFVTNMSEEREHGKRKLSPQPPSNQKKIRNSVSQTDRPSHQNFKEKKILVGNVNIESVIQSGLYVDKTGFIQQWLKGGEEHLYIIRPRRFGKSLLLNTIEKICEGKKIRQLFQHCAIGQSTYDWPKFPVLKLDFSKYGKGISVSEFKTRLADDLRNTAEKYGIEILQSGNVMSMLEVLINQLLKLKSKNSTFLQSFGQFLGLKSQNYESKIVVLIDSYDSPLSAHEFEFIRSSEFNQLKNVIENLLEILKAMSADIQLTLVTGVFNHNLTHIGSGANHLSLISMKEEYCTLFGYTKEEINMIFGNKIQAMVEKSNGTKDYDSIMKDIETWYNGYRFSPATTRVFNPWSIINFFKYEKLKNYWFLTFNVTALFNYFAKNPQKFDQLLRVFQVGVRENSLTDGNHMKEINIHSLMYQSGYLTIKDVQGSDSDTSFILDFPNLEIKNNIYNVFGDLCYNATLNDCERCDFVSNLLENKHKSVVEMLNKIFENRSTQFFPDDHYKESLCNLLVQITINALTIGHPQIVDNKNEMPIRRKRIDIFIETSKKIYIWELKSIAIPYTNSTGIKRKKSMDSNEKKNYIAKLSDNLLETAQKQVEDYAALMIETKQTQEKPVVTGVLVFYEYEIVAFRFEEFNLDKYQKKNSEKLQEENEN